MRYYFIHDNGGRPFQVAVNAKSRHLTIHQRSDATNGYDTSGILSIKYMRLFIGNSPNNTMTKFSGGYGPRFQGNSLLVHITGLKYIAIGPSIFEFTAKAPITSYISPVGNNDVPYPYATDTRANIYLISELVMLAPLRLYHLMIRDDPYTDYYYPLLTLLEYDRLMLNYNEITGYYIKNGQEVEPYNFTIPINPAANYDRITRDYGQILIQYGADTPKIPLTKHAYCAICDEYNAMLGFHPFAAFKELIPRNF
jgi:hypothetical protein